MAHALYRMATLERESDSSHRALADLQRLFPTGTCTCITQYGVYTCNAHVHVHVGKSISQLASMQSVGCSYTAEGIYVTFL